MTNVQKTFQFTFGDLVAVHLQKEKRNWKFDLRWDVGKYVGQPEHSVEAALVYFPFKNPLLVRTDVAKLDMSEDSYKRFYYKRYDMHGEPTSTATRVYRRLEEAQIDFDQAPLEEADDSESDATTAQLMDAEELPEELTTEVRRRVRKAWVQKSTKPSHPPSATSGLSRWPTRLSRL